jgi:hypothetical protein
MGNIAIISFYVSFATIVAMVSAKSFQISSGKENLLNKLSGKTDVTVHSVYWNIKKFFSYFNRKSAIALVQYIAYHILSWGRKTYHWVWNKAHTHPPSKKVIDMVRGKGDVEKPGGASFYLKQISEDK